MGEAFTATKQSRCRTKKHNPSNNNDDDDDNNNNNNSTCLFSKKCVCCSLSKNPPPPPGFKHYSKTQKNKQIFLLLQNIQQNTRSSSHSLAFPKETAIARQTTEVVVVAAASFGFESLLKLQCQGNKAIFFPQKKEAPKSFLKETKHKSEVAIFRKYVLGGSRQNKKVEYFLKILFFLFFLFSPLGKFGSFPLVDG